MISLGVQLFLLNVFLKNLFFLQKSVDKWEGVWYYKQAVARKKVSTEFNKKDLKKI